MPNFVINNKDKWLPNSLHPSGLAILKKEKLKNQDYQSQSRVCHSTIMSKMIVHHQSSSTCDLIYKGNTIKLNNYSCISSSHY